MPDDRELARLAHEVDQLIAAVGELRTGVVRLLALEEAAAPQRHEQADALREIRATQGAHGERLARLEAGVQALADADAREERASRRIDALLGPDGYLRSRAFLVALTLLALAVGAVTVDQVVAYLGGVAPVLVPAPLPVPGPLP